MLNLLTATGLRSIPLNTVSEIRLTNQRLNAELQDALAILTQVHSRDKKTVTLQFLGDGERPVRVGYIQELPLWKTSYRLVLKPKGPPLLQGWAIVENTTEHDWQDVNLTLVNGRPISFIMDLYQPLYVARPVVAPETFASLRPQTHGQDLAAKEEEFVRAAERANREKASAAVVPAAAAAWLAWEAAWAAWGWVWVAAAASLAGEGPKNRLPLRSIPCAGVQAAAHGDDVGELFRYQIREPVVLNRQQSAMLPIVNESVQGDKLSLYNPAVQAKHPLNAVQLVNSTELHLMQGPITIFDGGEYAGDARIEDLAPGSRRLITYALDLDTEITVQRPAQVESLASARISHGTLEFQRKFVRTHEYVSKNSGSRAKKVLIEQPIEAEWKLVAPEAAEKPLYRFAVTAEPGQPATLLVKEEKLINATLALTAFTSEDDAAFYRQAPVVSAAVRKAIVEVIRRKHAIAETTPTARRWTQDRSGRGRARPHPAEHGEARQELDLYKRYVKKFGAQEDEVEKLRPQVEALLLQAQQELRGPGRIYRVAQSRLNRAASQSRPRRSRGRKGPVDPAGQIWPHGADVFALLIAVPRDPMSHAPAAGGEVSLVPAESWHVSHLYYRFSRAVAQRPHSGRARGRPPGICGGARPGWPRGSGPAANVDRQRAQGRFRLDAARPRSAQGRRGAPAANVGPAGCGAGTDVLVRFGDRGLRIRAQRRAIRRAAGGRGRNPQGPAYAAKLKAYETREAICQAAAHPRSAALAEHLLLSDEQEGRKVKKTGSCWVFRNAAG